jgi:uncharacterized protein (DUF2342 family)
LQNASRKTCQRIPIRSDAIVEGHVKSILDPSFRYIPSCDTDLRETFARIRRDHREKADRAAQATAGVLANVSSIVRKTAAGR